VVHNNSANRLVRRHDDRRAIVIGA